MDSKPSPMSSTCGSDMTCVDHRGRQDHSNALSPVSPLYRSNPCSSACQIKNGKRGSHQATLSSPGGWSRSTAMGLPLPSPPSPALAHAIGYFHILGYVPFNIIGQKGLEGLKSPGNSILNKEDGRKCAAQTVVGLVVRNPARLVAESTITQYRICSPSPPQLRLMVGSGYQWGVRAPTSTLVKYVEKP